MKKYPEVKAYKTSALVPLRAAQSNSAVAENYEVIVNKALAMQKAQGWHAFGDIESIPLHLKYNMDEVGANGNLKRTRKMGSTKQQVFLLLDIFLNTITSLDPSCAIFTVEFCRGKFGKEPRPIFSRRPRCSSGCTK